MEENNNIKNITTDELAVLINNGFNGMEKRMSEGFDGVNVRLDRIENILIKQQNDKIEKLEERMHKIEEALIIK